MCLCAPNTLKEKKSYQERLRLTRSTYTTIFIKHGFQAKSASVAARRGHEPYEPLDACSDSMPARKAWPAHYPTGYAIHDRCCV